MTAFREIDERPMTGRQRKIFAAAVLADMLEFFDYFLLGFIISIIVGPWGLTYGETAVLLLTSGVGAIAGGFVWGWLADKLGRRRIFIATVLTFSLATGAMALVPDGAWLLLALLRFVVGFGVGGLYSVDLPLVQEFVPSGKRGLIGGLVTVFVPVGLLLGSLSTLLLGEELGWRALVLIGTLPALLSLYIRSTVPESPRWLLSQGRREQARAVVAWALETPEDEIELPADRPAVRPRFREVFEHRRSLAVSWIGNLGAQTAEYGIILWGPTLLVLTQDVTPREAAFLFIFVSLAGLAGRVFFSYLSERTGRPRSGGVFGLGGAVLLVCAALVSQDATMLGISAFFLLMMLAFFFTDGGFAIVGPYAAEVWPTHMRTTGMGSAYGFGGLGKIIGPVGLALIAGSSKLVSPEATIAAITPGFLFLACFAVLAAVAYLCGPETRGRTIDELDGGVAPSVAATRFARGGEPVVEGREA
jgi:putative MFS transporter